MASPVFQLRFPISEIDYWAKQYPSGWDDNALAAGRRIHGGDYSRQNLLSVVEWKSTRRKGLIARNSDAEISDALRLALDAKEPRSAFAVLMGLWGVRTPMASAILTAIDQEKYTVIDYRALEALGVPESDTDLNFYLEYYFPECKRLALAADVTLRTLDRALWAWSSKNGQAKATSVAM